MLFTTAHNHCLLLITSSRLPGWHGLFRQRPACLLHRQASEFECHLCWSSSAHATHQLFGWVGPTPTPPWHRWQSNEFESNSMNVSHLSHKNRTQIPYAQLRGMQQSKGNYDVLHQSILQACHLFSWNEIMCLRETFVSIHISCFSHCPCRKS